MVMLLTLIMVSGIIPSGVFAPLKARAAVGNVFGSYTITDVLGSGNQTVVNGKVYEVADNGNNGIITVPTGATVYMVFSGNATRTGTTSRIQIQGTGILVMAVVDGTENSITCTGTLTTAGAIQAGIYIQPSAALHIVAVPRGAGTPASVSHPNGQTTKGTGKLNVTGGRYAPGIGGLYSGSSTINNGTVRITGGVINATCESTGAAIGGGYSGLTITAGSGGNIEITNAQVSAISGFGAGIGGGGNNNTGTGGAGGSITITNSVVTASSVYGAGIGGGGGGTSSPSCKGGAGGTISISNSTIIAKTTSTGAGIGGAGGGSVGGAGGSITITNSKVYASTSYAASYPIGPGIYTNDAAGAAGSLKITDSNVWALNGTAIRVAPQPLGEENDTLYCTAISFTNLENQPLAGAQISVANLGSTNYVYNTTTANSTTFATTDANGKAWIWLPAGTTKVRADHSTGGTKTVSHTVAANNNNTLAIKVDTRVEFAALPSTKVYTGSVTLNLSAINTLGEGGSKEITEAYWFRESKNAGKTYTKDTFIAAYNAVGTGDKGDESSLNQVGGDLIDRADYELNADKNGRYWAMVKFIADDGDAFYRVDKIDVDKLYTPIGVSIRGIDVVPNDVLYDYTLINGNRGIPYDLDGTTVITSPSLGFDSVTIAPLYSATYWKATVGGMSAPLTLTMDKAFLTNAYCDNGDYTKYTLQYTRQSNMYIYIKAEYVDNAGNPKLVFGLDKTVFKAPLDFDISTGAPLDTVTNFHHYGGVFEPDRDDDLFPIGYRVIEGAWNDATPLVPQIDYASFDPQIPSVAANHTVYIEYLQPLNSIKERYETSDGQVSFKDTYSYPDKNAGDVYDKGAKVIPGYVPVGYRVDGVWANPLQYLFDAAEFQKSGLAPDESQQGQLNVHIDNADIPVRAIVTWYYEVEVFPNTGIPASDGSALKVYRQGRYADGNATVIDSFAKYTRTGYQVSIGNDDTTSGDAQHIIPDNSGGQWLFDSAESANWTLTPIGNDSHVFYYDYDGNLNGTKDGDEFVTEKYELEDGTKVLGDSETLTPWDEAYSKASPILSGVLLVGYKLDGGALQDLSQGAVVSFDMDGSNHTVTFVYQKAIGLSFTVNASDGTNIIYTHTQYLEKDVTTIVDAPSLVGYELDANNANNYSDGTFTGNFGGYSVTPSSSGGSHTFYYNSKSREVFIDAVDTSNSNASLPGYPLAAVTAQVGENVLVNAPAIAGYELVSSGDITKTHVVSSSADPKDNVVTFEYKIASGKVRFEFVDEGSSAILVQVFEDITNGTSTTGLAPTGGIPQMPVGWTLKNGTGEPSSNDSVVGDNTVITYKLQKDTRDITVKYYEKNTTDEVAGSTVQAGQVGALTNVVPAPTNLTAGYVLDDASYKQITVSDSGANEVIFYYSNNAASGKVTTLSYYNANLIYYSVGSSITVGSAYGTVNAPIVAGYKDAAWRDTSAAVSGLMVDGGVTVIFDYNIDEIDVPIYVRDEQGNPLSGVSYIGTNGNTHYNNQTAQVGSDVVIYAPHLTGFELASGGAVVINGVDDTKSATFEYREVAQPDTYVTLTVKGSDGTNELTSYATKILANTNVMINALTLPGYVLDDAAAANYSDGTLTGVFGKRLINAAADTSYTFIYKKNVASITVDFLDQATGVTISGQSPQSLSGAVGETLTINAPIIADYELAIGEQPIKTATIGIDTSVTFTYKKAVGNVLFQYVEDGDASHILAQTREDITTGTSTTGLAPTSPPQIPIGWMLKNTTGEPSASEPTVGTNTVITFVLVKETATVTVHYYEKGTQDRVASDTTMQAQIGTNAYITAQPYDLASGYTISELPYQSYTVTGTLDEIAFEYERGVGVITVLGRHGGQIIHYSTQQASSGLSYGTITAPVVTGYTDGTWDSNSAAVSGIMPDHDITIVFDYIINEVQLPIKVQDQQGNPLGGISYANSPIYTTQAAQVGSDIVIYAPHFSGYAIVGNSSVTFGNVDGTEVAAFVYIPIADNFVKITVNANVGAVVISSYITLAERGKATTITASDAPGYILDTTRDENYSNGDKSTGIFGEYAITPNADDSHTFYYIKNIAAVAVDFVDHATGVTIVGKAQQTVNGTIGETITINAPIIPDYELISGESATKTATIGTDASITFTYKKMQGNVLFQYKDEADGVILAQTSENIAFGTSTSGLIPTNPPQIPTGWALKNGTGTPSASDTTVGANTIITFALVKDMRTITVHYYEDGTTNSVATDTTVQAQLGVTLYVLSEPTDLNSAYRLKGVPYQQHTVINGVNEVIFYYEPITGGEGLLTVLGYSSGDIIYYYTETVANGAPYGTVVAATVAGYTNGTWRSASDVVSGTMTPEGKTVIFDYDMDIVNVSITITDVQGGALSGVTYQNQASKLWQTQTQQTGSDVTIYAPAFAGYAIVGNASETLNNVQAGAGATFVYEVVSTTVTMVDIPIYVVDGQGNALAGVTYKDDATKLYATQSAREGSDVTIYAPALFGWAIEGDASKQINGVQATDNAMFVYKQALTPPISGKLTIIVTIASTGAAQQGAKVIINGTEHTTNAQGRVEIVNATFAAYAIEASYSDYNQATANVTLDVGNPDLTVYLALGKNTENGGGGSSTARPTANLTIRCVVENGNDIFVKSLTSFVGKTEIIDAPTINGYKLADGEELTREITVQAGENVVIFKYVMIDDEVDTSEEPPPYESENKVENILETREHIQYISGYPDETVNPDGGMTRAEVATIYFRLLKDNGKDTPVESEFLDVDNDDWFAQAVGYLTKIGILEGYNEDGLVIFKPDQEIIREEFTAITARFDEFTASESNPFSDLSPENWAYDYILSSYAKGWIGGYPDGTFKPENPITRAEVVVIVNKVLERRIHKDDIPRELLTIWRDLNFGHWAFQDIIEASVAHEYELGDDDYENWTSYDGKPAAAMAEENDTEQSSEEPSAK
jgi:hypothetical protein